jgi:hypothetical protein
MTFFAFLPVTDGVNFTGLNVVSVRLVEMVKSNSIKFV